MTGGGAAIDNATPSHLQAEQCLLITRGLVGALKQRAGKMGLSQIRDAQVSGGSCPVVTNGHEEPPYLLTSKSI